MLPEVGEVIALSPVDRIVVQISEIAPAGLFPKRHSRRSSRKYRTVRGQRRDASHNEWQKQTSRQSGSSAQSITAEGGAPS